MIYKKQGKLLVKNDKLCSTCCSTATTTTTTTTNTTVWPNPGCCGEGIPTPAYLLVTFSGIHIYSNECDCSPNASFDPNGSYILAYDYYAGECNWKMDRTSNVSYRKSLCPCDYYDANSENTSITVSYNYPGNTIAVAIGPAHFLGVVALDSNNVCDGFTVNNIYPDAGCLTWYCYPGPTEVSYTNKPFGGGSVTVGT